MTFPLWFVFSHEKVKCVMLCSVAALLPDVLFVSSHSSVGSSLGLFLFLHGSSELLEKGNMIKQEMGLVAAACRRRKMVLLVIV